MAQIAEVLEPDPKKRSHWWSLGALNCNFEGMHTDDLVYMLPSQIELADVVEIATRIKPNYPGDLLNTMVNSCLIYAQPFSPLLPVISRSWKVHFPERAQVRRVEADNEWVARLMSLFGARNPDDEVWNELESTLRYAHLAKPSYINQTFNLMFQKVQEILETVQNSPFSLSHNQTPSRLLTCVFRSTFPALSLRQKSVQERFADSDNLDHLIQLNTLTNLDMRMIVPEESLLIYKNILDVLEKQLDAVPYFYFDQLLLIQHTTVFESCPEIHQKLKQLIVKNVYRYKAAEAVLDSLERFYSSEEYRDMQGASQTFLLDAMDPKYNRDSSISIQRHRIMFDAFLQAIDSTSTEKCKIYCMAFSRFIFLEAFLWLELKDPANRDYREEFVKRYNDTMRRKGIETMWDTLLNTEENPQIDIYLRRYYEYRNSAMSSYYFKDKTMCTLLCRPFVNPSTMEKSVKTTVAITPQSYGSPGFALFSENTNEKLVNVAFPDGTTTSISFVTVCFTDNTSKELPLAFVKTWKCEGKGLEQMIYHMLEKETFEIPKFLYQYIHDVAKANCLFECVVELGRCPMLRHTGVGWFAIIYGLENIEAVKEVFPKYRKKVVDAFIKGMNSTLSHGSIIVYYSKLKKYLAAKDTTAIEKRISSREQSESCFSNYINQTGNYYIDKTFRDCMERHCYVFVAVFLRRFLRLAIQENQESLLGMDIDNFNKILQTFPDFQKQFSKEEFRKNMRNVFLNTGKLIPREKIEALFNSIWPTFHANILTKNVILNAFDISLISQIGDSLGEGSSANVSLARVRDYPELVIVKIFTNQFQLLADEISTLLRLQGHTNIVRILGYITKDNEYHGIVMEYCKGGSVMNALKDPAITVDEPRVVSWLYQAASALMFLHKNGIIHRDVNPNNMLLDETKKKLQITDLGISKVIPRTIQTFEERMYETAFGRNDDLGNVNIPDQPIPASGKADGRLSTLECGTPGYRAPEVDDGPSYTESIDVFSLGRTGCAMIHRTFQYPLEVVEVWPRDTVAPAFEPSKRLKDLLTCMMAHNASDRPTMAEVYKQLENMHQED